MDAPEFGLTTTHWIGYNCNYHMVGGPKPTTSATGWPLATIFCVVGKERFWAQTNRSWHKPAPTIIALPTRGFFLGTRLDLEPWPVSPSTLLPMIVSFVLGRVRQ